MSSILNIYSIYSVPTMIRHLGSSSRALSVPARLSRRNFTHFPVAFYRPIDRQFDFMEREMDRAFRHPFWTSPFTSISSLDLSQLPPLIVTENGTKKFKLEFDVSKFKPEEVRVKTTVKENTLQVEAKHEDETCKFEFSRTITVPSGTTLTDLKCRFSSDGTLTLEAPFVPPIEEKKEAIQDTDIPVQHT